MYLLFKAIHKLHVELQFLSQLIKSPWPVLVLSVSVLNGLTQPLENNSVPILKHIQSFSSCL